MLPKSVCSQRQIIAYSRSSLHSNTKENLSARSELVLSLTLLQSGHELLCLKHYDSQRRVSEHRRRRPLLDPPAIKAHDDGSIHQ